MEYVYIQSLCRELLTHHVERCCQTEISKAKCAKDLTENLSGTVPSCQEDVVSNKQAPRSSSNQRPREELHTISKVGRGYTL